MYIPHSGEMRFDTESGGRVRFLDGSQTNLIETTAGGAFGSGARLTQAGTWQSTSSRAAKMNISPLSAENALEAFSQLVPVTYNYKVEPNELSVGFIAEDVPDLVATDSRKHLSPLDLIALLTKVVQEQQKTIEQFERAHVDAEHLNVTIRELQNRLEKLENGTIN